MNILLAAAAAARLLASALAPAVVLLGVLGLTVLAVALIAALFRGGRR